MEDERLKFGLGVNATGSMQETLEKSIYAEKLGFNSVWISDSPSQNCPFAVASAIAAKTHRIRVAFSLISPFLHSPRSIAGALLCLMETHGDRFELCIGPGDRNRLTKMGVALPSIQQIQRQLLKTQSEISETLRKEGFDVRIWLGAQGPKTLEMASSFSGILVNQASPQMIKWAVDRINQTGTRQRQIGTIAPTYVYENFNPRMFNLLRGASDLIASGASRAVITQLKLQEQISDLKIKLTNNVEPMLDNITEKAVQYFSIHMQQKQLQGYLQRLWQMGVNLVVFGYPQERSKENIKELADALWSGRELR